MPKHKVLIVEDTESKRESLADHMVMLGHEPIEAVNGLLGLVEARRHQPDLILLDLGMEVMDGMGFLAARKDDPVVKDIPVIIITGQGSREYDVAACIQNGADDILTMPPPPEILRARIENALTRRTQQKREVQLRGQLEDALIRANSAEKAADKLLRSIFPRDAVAELKKDGRIVPRRHEDVAVLFCDVVGFTPYCESHPADEVVKHLETLVEAQEKAAEEYGVEKVKTIGDCFMAVAGLIDPGDPSLLAAVRYALELAGLPARLKLPEAWRVRVGVHAGKVVAGQLGQRRFAYDLWGNTVNQAARIQGAADPGTVFVSAPVWHRISDRCQGKSRGPFELKGLQDKVELFQVEQVRQPAGG